MKRETKIKLTIFAGKIECIIGILVGIIGLLINNPSIKFKSLILAVILLLIGSLFVAYPEFISGVSKSQTQADKKSVS